MRIRFTIDDGVTAPVLLAFAQDSKNDWERCVSWRQTQTGRVEATLKHDVNISHLPEDQNRGIHMIRQGMRVYRDRLDRRMDPRGRPYYWIGGGAPSGS